jgi:ABC-type hemin transport system ATPase subunit
VIAFYMRAGYTAFILDVPFSEEDAAHAAAVFDVARRLTARGEAVPTPLATPDAAHGA